MKEVFDFIGYVFKCMGGSISAMFGDNGRMSWKDVLVAIIAWAVLLLIIFLIFYIFYRIRQK